jgi:hypothetical protein
MENWKRELRIARFETKLAEAKRSKAVAEADEMEAKVRAAKASIELRQLEQTEAQNSQEQDN